MGVREASREVGWRARGGTWAEGVEETVALDLDLVLGLAVVESLLELEAMEPGAGNGGRRGGGGRQL
jgi:hypothetical protein